MTECFFVYVFRNVRHQNVIQYYGICVLKGLVHVISEYAPLGDIVTYLKSKTTENILPLDILNLYLLKKFKFDFDSAKDSAMGMAYLSNLQIIHFNLAARCFSLI